MDKESMQNVLEVVQSLSAEIETLKVHCYELQNRIEFLLLMGKKE